MFRIETEVEAGQVLDFVNWCDYYAFDVMGGLAFNKDFGLLTGSMSSILGFS